jgi:hypothetical protein
MSWRDWEKLQNTLSDHQYPGLSVNQGHPECDEGALTTGPRRPMNGSWNSARARLVMMPFVGRVAFAARELLPFMWIESMALGTFCIYCCIEHLDSNVKLKKCGGDVQGQLWAKRTACAATRISEGQINIRSSNLLALYRVGTIGTVGMTVARPFSFWNSFNIKVFFI